MDDVLVGLRSTSRRYLTSCRQPSSGAWSDAISGHFTVRRVAWQSATSACNADCMRRRSRRRARLDEALVRLGWLTDYALIDADTLTPTDPRGGYGTPTVLFADRDLFGLPEPVAPQPSPT